MLASWGQGQLQRRGVERPRILPGTAGGFGMQHPQIYRRCTFDGLRAPRNLVGPCSRWNLIAIHVYCGRGAFPRAFFCGTSLPHGKGAILGESALA